MTIELLMTNLSVGEQHIVHQLEAHVRKVHRCDLAHFLFEQLQNGRAHVLGVNSAEFKGLTKWQ